MRRTGALLLWLGLCLPAWAGPETSMPEEPTTTSVPWYRWLFLGEREKPVTPTPMANAPRGSAATASPVSPGVSAAYAKQRFAEEQKIYLERLLAISQIRRIANEQGDNSLLRKADDLEAEAEEVFRMRTANLPRVVGGDDDRAALERGRDERPASAARPTSRRNNTRGNDR